MCLQCRGELRRELRVVNPFCSSPFTPSEQAKVVGAYAISSVIGEGGERLGEGGVCGVREECKECGGGGGDDQGVDS